jgi:hypothetical protein
VNRPLTQQERDWLVQGLQALSDPAAYLAQVAQLRVVQQCDCNQPDCHTINFQSFKGRKVQNIYGACSDDGRMLNIDSHTGELLGLEVI